MAPTEETKEIVTKSENIELKTGDFKSLEIKETKALEEIQSKTEEAAKSKNEKKYSFFSLFRYSDGLDKLIIAVAVLSSMAIGVVMPLMTIVFGEITTWFIMLSFFHQNNIPVPDTFKETFNAQVLQDVLYFVILGFASFVLAYLMMSLWMITGERQSKRIREAYFAAIMRQDIGWFDTQTPGELTTRISGDTQLMQDGISEKIGLCIQYFVTFLAGFVIAFIKGWKLALVLCSVFPLLAIAGGFMSFVISRRSQKGTLANSRQVLLSIGRHILIQGAITL